MRYKFSMLPVRVHACVRVYHRRDAFPPNTLGRASLALAIRERFLIISYSRFIEDTSLFRDGWILVYCMCFFHTDWNKLMRVHEYFKNILNIVMFFKIIII